MEIIYDNTLPCLQAIGPWWTELDRRNLFCRLMYLFPFTADYFSKLPAAKEPVFNGDMILDAGSIQNSADIFKHSDESKKCSCAAIRSFSFSFGKLNPRICYLCPYSGTYKNQYKDDEYRFLYHIMLSDKRTLNNYMQNTSKNMDAIFMSYFPAYSNGILIEAYPLAFFADIFQKIQAGAYLNNPEGFRNYLLSSVKDAIRNNYKYFRLKSTIEKYYPDTPESILLSVEQAMDEIINTNDSTRNINETMMKRLFNLLCMDKKKYIHKNPKDYLSKDSEAESPKLFQSSLFSGDALKQFGIINASTYSISDTKELESSAISSLPENPLAHMESDIFRNLPLLDSDAAKSPVVPDTPIVPEPTDKEVKPSVKDLGSGDETRTVGKHLNAKAESCNESKPKADITALPEQAPAEIPSSVTTTNNPEDILPKTSNNPDTRFPEYTPVNNAEDIFIYGGNDIERQKAILDVFFLDNDYFCMETASVNNMHGLLIMNSSNAFLFYDVDTYGPKPIHQLVNSKRPIYTANLYVLCRYLHRHKIYHYTVHDVSMAMSLNMNQILTPDDKFYKTPLPERFKSYKNVYLTSIASLSPHLLTEMKRMEEFLILMSADGNNPPFDGLLSLCRADNSLVYEFLYDGKKTPLRAGTFLYLRAVAKSIKAFPEKLITLYMDTLIDLNRHVPFYNGNIQLLKLNENGLLLYVMGNSMDIQKVRLYLTACARRAFSVFSTTENPITFEEKTTEYAPRKKS